MKKKNGQETTENENMFIDQQKVKSPNKKESLTFVQVPGVYSICVIGYSITAILLNRHVEGMTDIGKKVEYI